MGISKPYYRIVRPKAYILDYVKDERYASDRLQLSRAYINIEKELCTIFDYIEPDEANIKTFSFELYSLLLRACTEVELNCKLILEANGATPKHSNYSMTDYLKLEKSSLLSKYKVVYPNWRQRNAITKEVEYKEKEFFPFASFDISVNTSPVWYVAYNEVKHGREKNFDKANLENCMNAIAGILVLLYSQFGSCCIETYGVSGLYWDKVGDYDEKLDANICFEIYPPKLSDWQESELYDFEWNDIKSESSPFNRFDFSCC